MITAKRVLLPFLLLFVSLASHSQSELSDSKTQEITDFIIETMEEIGIPGAAVAVMKDDKVIYKNYIGKSNLEYNIPVTDSSSFRLHSLSKVFVAVGIFQLVEQNKISLEDEIFKYLPDVPEEWRAVKIKHLLTHSSGLPDMRDAKSTSEEAAKQGVYKKPVLFLVGERANYNQTNFWLLNRIIRKVTNGSFQDYISGQFGEGSKVCFSNISDVVRNRVAEYKPDSKGRLKNFYFLLPEYMYGAAGITMTLDNLIDWDKKLNKNLLITEASKNKMFTKFIYKVGTGFSYGWDVQNLNGTMSYGFNGGGLVNYRKFSSKNISIIWFTNGYRKPHNIDRITNTIVGLIDKSLIDKTPEAGKLLHKLFSSNQPEKAIEEYHTIKKEYPFVNFESVLNSLGYAFVGEEKVGSAIAVFKLNTEEYPKSANTFDSLAEGYYLNNQPELSKMNYQKSLELNPANANAIKMLKKLEE